MLVGFGIGVPIAWHGTRFRRRHRPAFRFRWRDLIPFSEMFDAESYTSASAAGGGFFVASGFTVAGLSWFLPLIGAIQRAPGQLPPAAVSAITVIWIMLVVAYALLINGKFDKNV